ncbi:hypothetical protein VTG60DRAFT_530 [Thermothelomyces hinnuleus]
MSKPEKPLSLSLRPDGSATRIFLRSQLCTKPKRLSPDTTSLAGQTALLTGGTTGIGYHAARHLLALGLSRLILTARSPSKGDRVASELRAAFPGAKVEIWPLELGDYQSVLALARRVEAEFSNSDVDEVEEVGGGNSMYKKERQSKKKARLDMAILNAGMAATGFARNPQTSHCQVVQVNYLSTFLLAVLLMPVLRDPHGRRPGRLTIVGSGSLGDAMERYAASKTLGQLFLVRLYDHLPPADELVVNLADPGFCKGSGLVREARGLSRAAVSAAGALFGRTLDDGAWTYLDAAVVQGKDSHGSFLVDWKISPFHYAVYEPEGQKLMDDLFEETMTEWEFAGAREILASLKRK